MRTRPAVALIAVTLLGGVSGCGAVLNGTVSTVTVRSSTPDAEVYINGGFAGKAPAKFVTGNAADQTVTVHAPGYEDKDVPLASKVRPVPILLDILWCFTILGVAAPISDGLLGTFVAVRPNEIDVTLERARDQGPTAVREFQYAPGDTARPPVAGNPSPPPVSPAAPPAEAACQSHADCAAGLVCPEGKCVTPVCKADKDCGAGKWCSVEGACESGKRKATKPVAPASKPCRSHTDCKGGLVCPQGRCVTPSCVADKECGTGRFCSLEGACETSKPRP